MKETKQSDIIKVRGKLTSATEILLFLLITFFPLFIFTDYTNLTAIKFYSFAFMTVFAFIYIGFWHLGLTLETKAFIKNLKGDTPLIAVLIFDLICIISYLFSPYKGMINSQGKSAFLFGSGRYNGFIIILLYGIIFWIFSRYSTFKKITVYLLCFTTFILSAITLIQFAGYNFLHFYPIFKEVTIFVSTIGNLGMYSAVMCVFLPILCGCVVLIDFKKIPKAIMLICIFIGALSLFFCNVSSSKIALLSMAAFGALLLFDNSKRLALFVLTFIPFLLAAFLHKTIKTGFIGALVFLALAVIYFGVYLILSKTKEFKITAKHRLIMLCVIIICLLMVLGFCYFKYDEAQNTTVNLDLTEEIGAVLHGKVDDTTGSYRIGVWKYSLKMSLKSPVIGTGIGTFKAAFDKFTDGYFVTLGAGKFDTPHNEFIQILCSLGFLGLITYLAFFVLLGVKAYKARKKPITKILLLGAVCYLVNSFFSFSIVISAPFLWITLGMLNNISSNKTDL